MDQLIAKGIIQLLEDRHTGRRWRCGRRVRRGKLTTSSEATQTLRRSALKRSGSGNRHHHEFVEQREDYEDSDVSDDPITCDLSSLCVSSKEYEEVLATTYRRRGDLLRDVLSSRNYEAERVQSSPPWEPKVYRGSTELRQDLFGGILL